MSSDAPQASPDDPFALDGGHAPVLAARGIRKAFPIGGRELHVLHGVDLDLHPGERLGLVGSSGAGKSTLLHSLGLLDRPTTGRVFIERQDGWSLSANERASLRNRKLGFVFQMYHLLPELTALENAVLPARILGGGRAAHLERRARAIEMLQDFGLGDRLKHRPSQLSGGEKQRVALARALVLDPPILIADEPTGNLDSATGQRILDLIFEQQERRTLSLLLVTHDPAVAERCDRVVHMADGLVVREPEGAEAPVR